MALTQREINLLINMVNLTRDQEITCDQCLLNVAEFAEHELQGKTIPDSLNSVAHHLSICNDCHEEYLALHQALENLHD